ARQRSAFARGYPLFRATAQRTWALLSLKSREISTVFRVLFAPKSSHPDLKAASVIHGDCMHLLRCQLRRDRAHLLADVVLAHALSEGRQLAFDIGGALPLQRRSAEFVTARTVTSRARRDAACRIPGEYQADRRIALPQRPPGFRNTQSGHRRQPAWPPREITRDIGRVFSRYSRTQPRQ